MRLARVFSGPRVSRRCLVSLPQSVALVVILSACSTQSQTTTVTQVPPRSLESEQCSIVGRLACQAMSILPGDAGLNRQATCVVVSKAGGNVVEQCGFVEIKPATTDVERRTGSPGSVQLAWSDNSDNEKNFVIERCDQVNIKIQGQKEIASCTSSWKAIATVEANTTRYVDKTVRPNQTYLYRVRAINDFGTSNHTNEMSVTTPSK